MIPAFRLVKAVLGIPVLLVEDLTSGLHFEIYGQSQP
jgi:hypothetical protein